MQGGTFADGSALTYFELGDKQRTILEIAQLLPGVQGLFAAIKAGADNWDGTTRLLEL